MRYMNKEELLDVVYGSAFFGGGGGGSMEEGVALWGELADDARLELMPIEEMEDDPAVVSTMVAALGSPVATKGKTFREEAVNAIKGMADEARASGKTLKYIYSGEQGGGNTMLPLFTAVEMGYPVLDLDGNGRAVPELNTGLPPVHDIPTSPVILASGGGDVITMRANDPLDSAACEAVARQACMIYDMGIGFSAWMMNKEEHLRATAIGQITLSQKVGHALRTASADGLAAALEACFAPGDISVLVPRGTIAELDINTEGGFDDGSTVVEAEDGRRFSIRFQNENLVVYAEDGTPLATVPNIISLVHLNGEGGFRALSNCETEPGQQVMLVVARAHPRWSDPQGYECWSGVLMDAGYKTTGPKVDL